MRTRAGREELVAQCEMRVHGRPRPMRVGVGVGENLEKSEDCGPNHAMLN